jgi:uncharacterized protein with HEPN domain
MSREVAKYLYDIQESIDAIQDYIGEGRDFTDFQQNKLIKRAVERELEIIGESINRILKLEPDLLITEAQRIVELSNWVVHGYDMVDDIVIWGLILKDIPELKEQVENLLVK